MLPQSTPTSPPVDEGKPGRRLRAMQQASGVEPDEPVHSGVERHLQRLRDAVARGSLPDARCAAAATRASLSALGPVGAEEDTISSRLVEEVAELLVNACKNAEKPVLPLIAAELCRVHPSGNPADLWSVRLTWTAVG